MMCCSTFKRGKISSALTKMFLTIEQSTDAFSVCSSVYRLKYPQKAEALASYMSLVRRIANEWGWLVGRFWV